MIRRLISKLLAVTTGGAKQHGIDIGYSDRRNALRLFAWHEVTNFGDKLGPAMFFWLTGRPVQIEAKGLSLVFDQGPKRTIYGFLGTLAQFLSGPHHFILWGIGISPPVGPAHHGCRPIERGLDIEFRALRGPLTRNILLSAGYEVPANIPYGDPGLLIPYFFEPSRDKIDDFCLVPHHTQYQRWKEMFPDKHVIDINIEYNELQSVVTQITRFRTVFSSSLHACILAESFGIPVIPVEPTLPFKFDDFYLSVGKTINYVERLDKDMNFEYFLVDAVTNFTPIQWDPRPWLSASPLTVINGCDIESKLSKHYSKLRDQWAGD
jgi:pyruvyltransferase